MLNIVLYEPEIPANTGNIGRTCVATGTRLHLIEPLGFKLNEKSLKRAGMDYWKDLDVTTYIDYQDFLEKNPGAKIYMATTKAHKVYTDVEYVPDCSIAMQFPQSSNTSNFHKMACSHHFIPFSVFGVSISINCLFVRAQTQFILLTLTSNNQIFIQIHKNV